MNNIKKAALSIIDSEAVKVKNENERELLLNLRKRFEEELPIDLLTDGIFLEQTKTLMQSHLEMINRAVESGDYMAIDNNICNLIRLTYLLQIGKQ